MDEEEHSIEMHLPFVAHVMKQQLELEQEQQTSGGAGGGDYSVGPIMIGELKLKWVARHDPFLHFLRPCFGLPVFL